MENTSDAEFAYPYNYIDDYYEICLKKTVAGVGSTAVPVFLSIVILLSLIGNILVLVILGLYKNLKSLTNVFVLNSALSDLMFTLGLPFWTFYYVWGWTFGDTTCKGVNFVSSAGFYSRIVFLMLMTIQHYVAVVSPLSDWDRGQRSAVVFILAWVLSFTVAMPALLYSEVMPDPEDPNTLYCEYNSMKSTVGIIYEQNVFFVSAFLVTGFCYMRILLSVLQSRTGKSHRTMRLVFCMVVVFFISWAPYNVVIFLQTLTYHQIQPFTECYVTDYLDYAFYACRLLAFFPALSQSSVLCFVGEKIQNHLKNPKKLGCCAECK